MKRAGPLRSVREETARSNNEEFPSVFLQQCEQFPVKLIAIPILVIDIGASRIQQAEGSNELPQREAYLVFTKDVKHVGEPGEKNIVRSFVPASTLAAMNTHTRSREFYPGARGSGNDRRLVPAIWAPAATQDPYLPREPYSAK